MLEPKLSSLVYTELTLQNRAGWPSLYQVPSNEYPIIAFDVAKTIHTIDPI